MPIDQIITRAIEDNAVITETLANGSVTTSKIPDGTITEDKFTQGALNSVSALRFANVSGPSGVGYTDLNSVETVTINGAGFQSGVRIFLDNYEVAQANITYRNSNTIDFVVPSLAPDKYHVWIYNPDGGSVVKPIGLQFVSPPTWQTVSIPAATQYSFYSTSVVASSLETLTYSSAASLPPGLSITPSGVISGYPIASAGSYFIGVTTKTTTGIENTRYFTLNLSAGSFVANVDIMTVAGGAGGAHGGGGAGGFRIVSNAQISSSGNISVVVGAGGTSTFQDAYNTQTGQYDFFYGITRGGAGGNSIVRASGNLVSQSTGGSGGGAGGGISYNSAFAGGSGGGGAFAVASGTIFIGSGGAGNLGGYTPPEGYAGGNAGYNTTKTGNDFDTNVWKLPDEKAGGGGGGAGGPGFSVISGAFKPTGGAGGPPVYSTFTGANVAYAGGGGGGGGQFGGAGGGAGAGSGGFNNVAYYLTGSGGDALPNTGSGGGGYKHGSVALESRSGAGGSGIVYLKLYPSFGFFTGGNLVSQTGGVSLYEYKTSNIFVISNSIVAGTSVTWITATSLPDATISANYSITLIAQSQVYVYYQPLSGNLPSGLSFNGSNGTISGRTFSVGSFSLTIRAVNIFGVETTRTFTLQVVGINVSYLVVAGGGGGGGMDGGSGSIGGGGGAGGLLTGDNITFIGTTYTITVGGGGSGAVPSGTPTQGSNGGNSSVIGTGVSIISVGGGGGGSYAFLSGQSGGRNGGSGGGGGGAGSSQGTSGGLGTVGQGNNGASNWAQDGQGAGGGGGGAGSAGGVPSASQGGAGGAGLENSLSGTSLFYAAGGGGGPNGTGGSGIGGSNVGGANGTAGAVNRGAGGGGARVGGSGGSGVIIFRYQGTPLYSGGSVQVVQGFTYHTFTTSGILSLTGNL